MPYTCCVAGCKGNYNEANKVKIFGFPRDPQLLQRWLKTIPRKNLTITKNTRVCELHFRASDIERETSIYHSVTGEKMTAPLLTPRLAKGAVPSIFPGCSPVSSEEEVINRAATRFEEIERDIKRILPSLEEKTVKRVLERLDELGVENYSHLSLIEERDLKDVLKVIQIRLLLASWKNNTSAPAVTTQSFIPNIPTTSGDQIAVTVDEKGYIMIPKEHSSTTNSTDTLENESVHLSTEDESSFDDMYVEEEEEDSEEWRNENTKNKYYKRRHFKPVPLPEFSPILQPLLRGHPLSKKDQNHLSSMLKGDLIAYLNRENLISHRNPAVMRWQYRDLGETLKRRYPNMLWDSPGRRQVKMARAAAPVYSVFIHRLSMRRKQKMLREKLKTPRLEEKPKEDALVALEQEAVDSRSVNPSASTLNSVMPMPNPLTVAVVPDSELLLTPDLTDDRSDSEKLLDVQIKIEPDDSDNTLLHLEQNNTNSVPTELLATTNGRSCPQPIVPIKKVPITIKEEPML